MKLPRPSRLKGLDGENGILIALLAAAAIIAGIILIEEGEDEDSAADQPVRLRDSVKEIDPRFGGGFSLPEILIACCAQEADFGIITFLIHPTTVFGPVREKAGTHSAIARLTYAYRATSGEHMLVMSDVSNSGASQAFAVNDFDLGSAQKGRQ